MSAVSNSVMPRSIALWITLREASRSVRWPKLLQPRPTAETRRPEPPRLRICMNGPERSEVSRRGRIVTPRYRSRKVRSYGVDHAGLRRPRVLRLSCAQRRRGEHSIATPGQKAGEKARQKRGYKKVRPRSDAATDG